jgi:hypothetical protein
MDFLNLAQHFLTVKAVIGMALRHVAQLAHVQRFAQVQFRVRAVFCGQRPRPIPVPYAGPSRAFGAHQ